MGKSEAEKTAAGEVRKTRKKLRSSAAFLCAAAEQRSIFSQSRFSCGGYDHSNFEILFFRKNLSKVILLQA
jgi:hypothetical protein